MVFRFSKVFSLLFNGKFGSFTCYVFYQCYISFNELMQLFFYFEGLESIKISNLDRI